MATPDVQKTQFILVRYAWTCPDCNEAHVAIQTPEEEFEPYCCKK